MNDPDPSLSQPPAAHEAATHETGTPDDGQINGQSLTHGEGNGNGGTRGWFSRLANSWISRLSNSSLRSQMEGALADDDGGDETFSDDEKAMLRNILSLREMRVDDIMVPRAEIDAVEDDISLGTLLAIYEDVGHSRLPVYRETLDDPIGMVHIKDVVGLMTTECCITKPDDHRGERTEIRNGKDHQAEEPPSNHPHTLANVDLERPLKDLGVIRDILFVPPSMPAIDLMATMRTARTQMALVIDEYGGTDGLISLEDVVETVVGDIEDEHDDEDEVYIAEAGPNQFIADARADLEDVIATIGMALPLNDESFEDVDTLGGFIFTHIGRIPVRGELIAVTEGLEFEIIDADRRRIRRIRIRIKPTRKPLKRSVLSRALNAEGGGSAPTEAPSETERETEGPASPSIDPTNEAPSNEATNAKTGAKMSGLMIAGLPLTGLLSELKLRIDLFLS